MAKAALSYFEHVVRAGGMEDYVMLGRMNGARKIGRPRQIWLDTIKGYSSDMRRNERDRVGRRGAVTAVARGWMRLDGTRSERSCHDCRQGVGATRRQVGEELSRLSPGGGCDSTAPGWRGAVTAVARGWMRLDGRLERSCHDCRQGVDATRRQVGEELSRLSPGGGCDSTAHGNEHVTLLM